MDIINQALAQLSELFRNMSAGSRITAGLLLVVAVVSVGYLFQNQVTGGDEFLFNGASIDSETLNKMTVAFGKLGLNSHTIIGGQIKVPRSLRDKYMGCLADANALPKQFGTSLENAIAGGTLIDPPTQRAERIKLGLQRELALIISSMQGIESASVLLDQQQQSGFEPPLRTATVFVRTQGSARLDREQAKKIRYLLSGAWAGLKNENVTVGDPAGPVLLDNDNSGDSLYQSATLEAEHNLREKVLGALSYIRGVTVTPTVVLDPQKLHHSIERKRDPKAVPIHTIEDSTTDNHGTAAPGGAPGLDAQANGARSVSTPAGGAAPVVSQKEVTKSITDSVTGLQETETDIAPFVPKQQTVSIGIPNSYYESVWRDQNAPKPGEDAKKLDTAAMANDIKAIQAAVEASVKKTVVNLLLPVEGVADRNDLVSVMTFQDIKMPDIASPPITQTAATWFDANWRTLAIGGLVVVSLMMLRTMIRSIPTPEPEVASARVSANDAADAKEEPVEATVARKLRRVTGTGPSLRDELSDLVKEDPDSAANILRAWIGQVA